MLDSVGGFPYVGGRCLCILHRKGRHMQDSYALWIYLPGLVLFVGGAVFVILNVVLSHLIHPHVRTYEKYVAYECGEDPVGGAWIQFNHRFYLLALAFVVFDVEVVLLFPWVVVFREFGWFGFIEVLVFIAVLLFGLAYAWKKEALVWDKPQPMYSAGPVGSVSVATQEMRTHGTTP